MLISSILIACLHAHNNVMYNAVYRQMHTSNENMDLLLSTGCYPFVIFRFLESSLISGEGLVSVDVASDAAQEELSQIHRENIERLAGFSEEEILKEKERIQQTLGMLLVCVQYHVHVYIVHSNHDIVSAKLSVISSTELRVLEPHPHPHPEPSPLYGW